MTGIRTSGRPLRTVALVSLIALAFVGASALVVGYLHTLGDLDRQQGQLIAMEDLSAGLLTVSHAASRTLAGHGRMMGDEATAGTEGSGNDHQTALAHAADAVSGGAFALSGDPALGPLADRLVEDFEQLLDAISGMETPGTDADLRMARYHELVQPVEERVRADLQELRTVHREQLAEANRSIGDQSARLSWMLPVLGAVVAGCGLFLFWNERHRRRAAEFARLNREKDRFIASVSHELRTPLTGVVGLTAYVHDNLSQLTRDEMREMLILIRMEAGEMTDMIEDLLTAARVRAETLSVKPVDVDILELITDLVSRQSSITPRVVIDPDAAFAWADPLRVRQVARNLLTNAERYGGDDIAIETLSTGQHVILEVSDDGPGIPTDMAEAIFNPYHQGSHSSALGEPHPDSIGLGLAVSRDLARLMGGELTYFRRDSRTVFALTLLALPPGTQSDSARERDNSAQAVHPQTPPSR